MSSEKIRILHIIKSLGRGGAEMLLPESLKLHDQDKFEFHYLYFLPWKDQMVKEIEDAGGKVTCFNASNNIKILSKASRVVDYCKRYEIDLIHCHLPWAGFLGRIVHYKSGIPTIYTEHNKQERYHKVTFVLNKFSFNKQSRVIAVSNDVAESIAHNIKPKIPVQTVLNGVNTHRFRRDPAAGVKVRQELGISPDQRIIGTIAVFRFQKRLVEWLQVFKAIYSVNPEARGIIVGAGPLEEEIMAERKRLGLEDVVFMPGLQTEVRPYLSAMDVYMMTSSFEGLPIALLEAMSMECAIVSTNAGGIREVITSGENGYLEDVDSWEGLANHALKLLDSEASRVKLGAAARTRVMEAFSMNRMVAELESCYEEILLKHS